jgi:hypothetical protein
MFSLIVLIEGYIARRDTDLGTMYSIEWRMTGKSVKKHAPTSSILCFGTSLTKLGVSPKILQEKLGKPAYCFALSGGQPFASYTMLKKALDSGSNPEAIVVDFKWSALAMEPIWNERVLPEMANVFEYAELALAARDATYFGRLFLVANLPSYRCREEIRANVMAAVQGKEPKRNFERWIMTRNAQANQGATHTPINNDFHGEVSKDDPHLCPKDWKCHPVAEQYVDKFLALAESRKIPVFWLVPPVAPNTLARRVEIGAEDKYTQFMKSVLARHKDVTVVDGRFSKFALPAFFDMTHLNRDGAVAFTNLLVEVMARSLSDRSSTPTKWVNLPDYKPATNVVRIEDLKQSVDRIASGKKDDTQVK